MLDLYISDYLMEGNFGMQDHFCVVESLIKINVFYSEDSWNKRVNVNKT